MTAALRKRVVGQPRAIDEIVPYVRMHEANLSPGGRPVGVFLLLGPTGTGKTKTVEALAEVLHGSEKNLLRIDCGEFQLEHEVAKLIGAPPGYLGHRETHPMISQQKLNATTSEFCGLSIVLLDEIEKAAPSLGRLLLGVLDKGTLHLGDNTVVNFENSLIFLTSNLGAREMMQSVRPGFGYRAAIRPEGADGSRKLERIAMHSVSKQFSPEFVNRIDSIITYEPLNRQACNEILDIQIGLLQDHIYRRLGSRAFDIEVSRAGRDFLLDRGVSPEYGAREIRRVVYRHVTQPLADMVATGKIEPGGVVHAILDHQTNRLRFLCRQAGAKGEQVLAPEAERAGKDGHRTTADEFGDQLALSA